MKLFSQSWINGERIPPRCAGARLDAEGRLVRAENRHPHLAWEDVPTGTLSFALIAHDFDGLAARTEWAQAPAGAAITEDTPRTDFFLWVLADLPPSRRQVDEGEFSAGLAPTSQQAMPAAALHTGPRHGLNDYSGALPENPLLGLPGPGDYTGYGGPWPPMHDELVHHCVFTLYALDVARAPVGERFSGHELRRAIYPHVLVEATLSGTYTLNPLHARSQHGP